MQKIIPEVEAFARIKVVGAGGSGKNATNHMINSKVKGVEFIAINTDAQDLHHSLAKKKIHIGKNLTRGLGTGMNPDLGKRAAEETREEIQESLKGADMIFIAGGLGGGTFSGAGPVIAKIARELGALTVAVVTRPFSFEGAQRLQVAEQALEELRREVDAIIIIPNDRLLAIVEKETTLTNAFSICDEVLRNAVEGISDLITTPGIINVDFADIRSIMKNAGAALMGIGAAGGDDRAVVAAKAAINSPLLDLSITGAKGVLFAIAGGEDLRMAEVQEAARVITEAIDPNARVIFGAIKDPKVKKNEIKITVIASGFPELQGQSSTLFKNQEAEAPARENTQQNTQAPAGKGKIYNSLPKDNKPVADIKRAAPSQPEQTKNNNNDDDDWGVVPAFLRRKK
ncbi:MAG: cell division protein FtsZ [Candidatus Paceibacterota bacterium]